MAQMVKNMPAMQQTWVRSVGQDGPLENERGTALVFFPEEFDGHRSLVSYSPWDSKESDMNGQLTFSLS